MKDLYIYNCADDYYFYSDLIARIGDTISIEDDTVKNLTFGKIAVKMPEESIANLISKCIIHTDESDYIEEFKDNTEKSSNVYDIFRLNSDIIPKLINFGILKSSKENIRNYNIGKSNYSKHVIQPWAIWQDYNLNPWDADIIKRILRTKDEACMTEIEARTLDYQKIIHICQERIRQLKS